MFSDLIDVVLFS